jgi:PhnB protein
MTQIAVHLVVDDAAAAAAWYVEVLGARETSRVDRPDGRPLTVELRVGDTVVAVAGAAMESKAAYHVRVEDVDAVWAAALAAGATPFEAPHDAFWGERTAQFLDPSGHRWAIDQHLRDVEPDEIAQHVAAMFA